MDNNQNNPQGIYQDADDIIQGKKLKSIIQDVNELGHTIKLNEEYEVIEHVDKLKTRLYPHQQTVVKALVDIENKRYQFLNTKAFKHLAVDKPILFTDACVLSEPFGSGKTIEILAFLLYSEVPRVLPEHQFINNYHSKWLPRPGDHEVHKSVFYTEVITKYNKFIRSNLIVVGKSVLVQWENAIKQFTDLSVFTIGSVHNLKKFYEMYLDDEIKYFDIILLKNGTVTNSFLLPGEKQTDIKSTRPLLEVMSKITSDSCWKRVIYDDFDTIEVAPDVGNIHALFTIYVSATKRYMKQLNQKTQNHKNIIDLITSESFRYLSKIQDDKNLFTNFNVVNEQKFTEKSTSLPKIDMHKYVYSNPDDNYIRLIGAMGENDANTIMEMLNADAITTAAENVGIKSTSVADIFEKILSDKYQQYLEDTKIIDIINDKINEVKNLEPHPKGRYQAAKIEDIKMSLLSKGDPIIEYNCAYLMSALNEAKKMMELRREQDGVAIQRVKDNIKEGDCPVCCFPLDDEEINSQIIFRCCGVIICDNCVKDSTKMYKKQEYKSKNATIAGKCPNCSKDFVFHELIVIDKDFDIETLLDAKGDETEPEPELESVQEPEPESEEIESVKQKIEEIKNPKLKALFSIINGMEPENKSKLHIDISHLLGGNINKPPTRDIKRKALLFANYNETLELVEAFCKENDIKFMRLQGTFRQMSNIINEFVSDDDFKILLINSSQNCAGLNLQFASDIIFFHKILDRNIESQVIGRGQRIGREYNLNVHYLLYDNEKLN